MTWQDLATAGIVLVAAVYLGRSLLRFAKRKGTPCCGGCVQCPTASAEQQPLVVLNPPREQAEIAKKAERPAETGR